jgi:hypothetical protein
MTLDRFDFQVCDRPAYELYSNNRVCLTNPSGKLKFILFEESLIKPLKIENHIGVKVRRV